MFFFYKLLAAHLQGISNLYSSLLTATILLLDNVIENKGESIPPLPLIFLYTFTPMYISFHPIFANPQYLHMNLFNISTVADILVLALS